MRKNEIPEDYILKFPTGLRCFFLILGLIGTIAFIWLLNNYQYGEVMRLSKFQLFLLFCMPIGYGLFLMTFERIEVKKNKIKKSFLFWVTEMDRKSIFIHKKDTNGFTIIDGKGKKIRSHRLLKNSEYMVKELDNKNIAGMVRKNRRINR